MHGLSHYFILFFAIAMLCKIIGCSHKACLSFRYNIKIAPSERSQFPFARYQYRCVAIQYFFDHKSCALQQFFFMRQRQGNIKMHITIVRYCRPFSFVQIHSAQKLLFFVAAGNVISHDKNALFFQAAADLPVQFPFAILG